MDFWEFLAYTILCVCTSILLIIFVTAGINLLGFLII
jgi:hypothetical protein